MDNRLILCLLIAGFLCSGLSFEKSKNFSTEQLQKIFEKTLQENVVYTKVPRGLIISIGGDFFFNDCETRIKTSAFQTLDKISDIIKNIPNELVIEDHSSLSDCVKNLENWEVSAMRSSNIAEYFVNKRNIPNEQIFDIGYADFMPLKTEISSEIQYLKNRIDFVIINFEAKR